jgi:hypothetical protein
VGRQQRVQRRVALVLAAAQLRLHHLRACARA